MKIIKRLLTSLIFSVIISTNSLASSTEKSFVVTHQWIRLPAETSVNTAAYFNIHNNTNQDLKIIDTKIEDGVCQRAEIHGYKQDEQSVMKMFKLESITIPARTSIEFKPGSNHVMLMGLLKRLDNHSKYKLKLKFLPANAENNKSEPSELEIEFPVK